MSELIEILRAKSGNQSNYLLKDHLKEAVVRVLDLYEFVKENEDSFNYKKVYDKEFFEKLVVAAILHDLGKMDYTFQNRVFRGNKETEDFKNVITFLKPLKNDQIRYPRHEILSTIWSIFLIGNGDLDKKIRTAILLHHYNEYFIGEKDLMEIVFNYRGAMVSYLKFIKMKSDDLNSFLDSLFRYIQQKIYDLNYSEDVQNVVKSALNSLNHSIDINKIDLLLEKITSHDDDISEFAEFYDVTNEDPDYDFLVLLGFLRRCDYASSGDVDIERGELKKVFNGLSNVIENEITKKNDDNVHIWQKDVLNSTENSDESLILVAPTGSGKTEFALMWAEKNKRKLIYTLPLRVALNDLFSRFQDKKEGYFDKECVDILHSTAFIEYMKEERDGRDLDMDRMMTSAQMLSSPVLLTTPDQVFLTSLNYYGSDKVISVYPFSSVVIDEIQTYNEEMAAIIIKTLEIINKLNGKILVITATFPPYFEKFFIDLFGKDRIIDVASFDGSIKSQIKNFDQRRHKIKVVEHSLFDRDKQVNRFFLEEFLEQFKDKNLFLVVNNVKKAIKLVKSLENDGNNNVYLLHSRLLEIEKSRRINEIKEKIKNHEKVTVVATQIIEASVNLDFDAMITEISTIDSQIQRWGRVYRNRKSDYSPNIPNIVIFTTDEHLNGSLKFDRGTTSVYDYKVLEKTFDVLKEHENSLKPLNYENEREMINEVFEREIEGVKLKELYEREIEKTLQYLDYFSVEKKSQAQKLFRNIAGYKVVVPELIRLDKPDDQTLNKFVEILENGKISSWKEIIEKIKKETGNDVDKWFLKRKLYEYSVNVPIFYSEKPDFWNKGTHEFKGFYIWDNISNEEIKSLKEYGIDSLFKNKNEQNTFL